MKTTPTRFHIALDSGAHSIYFKFLHVKTSGGVSSERMSSRADLAAKSKVGDYTRTKEFRDYLDKYVAFVRARQDKFDFCVSLDIIFNPERSYQLWCELEDLGVHTIPVIHHGEDTKWVKKYMDRTDYIGIGGMGQGVADRTVYSEWARKVFDLLTDAKGRPQWKTHGFALTSTSLMRKFPWTSVDSSSALYHSRMGNVVVPRIGPGRSRDFLRELGVVSVTPRRTKAPMSYENADLIWQKHVDAYVQELGFGKALELGQTYPARDACNIVSYFRVAQAISKEREDIAPPLKLYVSGKWGSHADEFMESVERIGQCGVTDFHYMGTHFILLPTNYLLKKDLCKGNAYENGKTIVRPQARPTLRRRN